MRIGLYHESAGDRESGGIAVFVREMALRLADRHDVVLLTKECDPVPELRRSSVRVVQIPTPGFEGRLRETVPRFTPINDQNVSKLLTFLAARQSGLLASLDERVDVVLTQQWIDDLLLSNALETPTVYTFHGFTNVGVGTRARGWLSDTSYSLANSRHTAERVRDVFGWPVDDVVYPGVDVERYSPAVEPAFEDDESAVLFVGRIRAQKGIYDLLDAFAPLADDATLHVVGRGDYADAESLARRLGITDAVDFHGVVPEADLPGYYAAADVYCLPSYYEGLGMGNLEAMATGCPVVTTDVGGVPEYATHEETALVTRPGDVEDITAQIERLIGSPSLREELGAAGRSVAEAFSWTNQAEKLASFCGTVVAGDSPVGSRPDADRQAKRNGEPTDEPTVSRRG